jgi:hypothetical protein
VHRDAVLQAEGAHLANHVRSLGDEAIAHAMQRLQVDLIGAPDLDKAHRRTRDGLGDRLRVDDVVLVRLHVGLDEPGRDDPHRVTEGHDLACQPLRARARLHAHDGRRCTFEELQHRVTPERGLLHRRARRIEANDVEDVLADVDAEDGGVARRIAYLHGCSSFWLPTCHLVMESGGWTILLSLTPGRRRELVCHVQDRFGVSERRGCAALRFPPLLAALPLQPRRPGAAQAAHPRDRRGAGAATATRVSTSCFGVRAGP